MINHDHLIFVYNEAAVEKARWSALGKSQKTVWEHNVVSQWLYKLVLDIANVKSLSDTEILPIFFGQEGVELLNHVIRSEYYFWTVMREFAFECSILYKENLEPADGYDVLKKTISKIRSDNTRITIDRLAVLEQRLSIWQICQFTAAGIILWSHDEKTWTPNPLWFTEKELNQYNA